MFGFGGYLPFLQDDTEAKKEDEADGGDDEVDGGAKEPPKKVESKLDLRVQVRT